MKAYCLLIFLFVSPLFGIAQPVGCFTEGESGQLYFNADSNLHLNRYRGFVIGEFHDISVVPGIKLALIKHLHEQMGINDVFMEIGLGAAWLYNNYLATGDTTYITHPALVYASRREGRAFWEALYKYNSEQGNKLKIHGFDFERMEFLKVLKMLQPINVPIPPEIKDIIGYIDTVLLTKVNDGNLVKVYNMVKSDIDLHETLYRAYYGDNYKLVSEIMHNKATYEHYAARNQDMYSNVTAQLRQQEMSRFILFAGEQHCDKGDPGSLCGLLMNNKTSKSSITNIAMLCNNGKDAQLLPGDTRRGFLGPHTYRDNKGLMQQIYQSLALQGLGCKYLLVQAKKRTPAKFSDYVLLIR